MLVTLSFFFFVHTTRSMTTWAQKLNRNHCKKSTQMDQIPAPSTQLHLPPEQEVSYS